MKALSHLSLAIASISLVPVLAQADFSPINSNMTIDVAKTILDRIYFGSVDTFVASEPGPAAPMYTGGGLTATRVDDFGLGGVLDMAQATAGTADDQLWSGAEVTAVVRSREAAHQFRFGCDLGPAGRFVPLVEGTIGEAATVLIDPNATLTWNLEVSQSSSQPPLWLWSSRYELHVDQRDRMITYHVGGEGVDETRWVVFWEDDYFAQSGYPFPGDGDFNDIVVELIARPAVCDHPADFDGDCDVDLDDFGFYQACLSGPGTPQTDPDCQPADLDGDNDVDLDDFGFFQACTSDPGGPIFVDCMD